MNNYASLGVDALVTLNFHKQRQSRPWLFANRLVNKVTTLQPLYNTVHYSTVLDKTRFKDGSQKCIDYIEKWP